MDPVFQIIIDANRQGIIYGKSTDTKPVPPVSVDMRLIDPRPTFFVEEDTSKIFKYDPINQTYIEM